MLRQPSMKLQDDVFETVRIAKGTDSILDVVLAAVGVQSRNRSENVALEDIVKLMIEEATRNQLAVEISPTELLLPTLERQPARVA